MFCRPGHLADEMELIITIIHRWYRVVIQKCPPVCGYRVVYMWDICNNSDELIWTYLCCPVCIFCSCLFETSSVSAEFQVLCLMLSSSVACDGLSYLLTSLSMLRCVIAGLTSLHQRRMTADIRRGIHKLAQVMNDNIWISKHSRHDNIKLSRYRFRFCYLYHAIVVLTSRLTLMFNGALVESIQNSRILPNVSCNFNSRFIICIQL